MSTTDLSRLLYQGGQVLSFRVSGAVLAFGSQLIVARATSTDTYGWYSIILAVLAMCAVVAKLGLDTTLVRYTSAYYGAGSLGMLLGLWRWARRALAVRTLIVISAAVLLAAALHDSLAADLLSSLPGALVLFCLLLAMAYIQVINQGLGGHFAFLPEQLIRPAVLCVLVLGCYGTVDRAFSIVEVLNLSSAAVAVAGCSALVYTRRLVGARLVGVRPELTAIRQWKRGQWPLLMLAIAMVALGQIDVVLVGLLAGETEAGIYGAAVRVAFLCTFVLAAANTLLAPLISSAYARGDTAKMQTLASQAVQACSLLTAAVVAVLFWQAEFVLGLFGTEFQAGTTALRVLLVSHLINTLSGLTGVFQTMTGHEKSAAWSLSTAALVSLVFGVALIPAYGILGAALATACATTVWSILGIVVVRRKLGISSTFLLPGRS